MTLAGQSLVDLTLGQGLRLEDLVDREALVELCKSFYSLFGISVRVISSDGLLADVHEEREVCRYVNSFAQGRAACSGVVDSVKTTVPTDTGHYVHPCFTGAVYRVVGIVYDGRQLGRIVIGPYLPAERNEVPRTLLTVAPEIQPDAAAEALDEMPRVREETARHVATHLQKTLDLILFSGHRAFLTSQMHLASVRESFRELSERNRQLKQSFDRLQELDRLKSNFLATISHELRTPLTSIIGYSDMLAEQIAGPLNEEQTEFVTTIRDKGDQLLSLITGLLDLSRLESGRMSVQLAPFPFEDLISDVAATATPIARKKGVELVVQTPGPGTIVADRERLRQVLTNLVDNALKFTPEGGKVSVRARMAMALDGPDGEVGSALLGEPRREAEVIVSDSGIGIPASEHQRIFDAFYQVDGSSTRAYGGTGLGLSIVKRLVDAHGGSIDVESAPGAGTTFTIRIPDGEARAFSVPPPSSGPSSTAG
ncbi:MAG: PocR ligand-binding domain-containing protein [Deltaproteobacteria bacterium]|nr:PocR ligand-binding domain-containing protein [Deltaproteobacteria bacterium]